MNKALCQWQARINTNYRQLLDEISILETNGLVNGWTNLEDEEKY